MKNLSNQIKSFLDKYAAESPNEEGEFTGPDPYELKTFAELLDQGIKPNKFPFSEWGSGCYKPYSSKEGQQEHQDILNQIKVFFGI